MWVNFRDQSDLCRLENDARAQLVESGAKVTGSFGLARAHSIYPAKNPEALVTSDTKIAEMGSRPGNYGYSNRYNHIDLGLNSRLDKMQAAFLSARLEWLNEFTSHWRKIAQSYIEGVSNSLVRLLTQPEDPRSHSYHLFVVNCDERQKQSSFLADRGIEALIHYPIPVHRQPAVKPLALSSDHLVNSDIHASTCLSIPCHPGMTNPDVDDVISAINEFTI
jgi:dTDP-4-amino-4,6-dideoxygalactose transaminase